MTIRDAIKTGTLFFDGGCGTSLQAQGLRPGELPERWNLQYPDRILALHRAYLAAGAQILKTNTFGANPLKFDKTEHKAIIQAGAALAKQAVADCADRFVALDIGPLGRLLAPLGDLGFEDAVTLFAQTAEIGAACGVDCILIETMMDSLETKAAVLAAKETNLPVLVTNTYGADGKLLTGATPAAMAVLLEGLRVDALGANCGLGPKQLLPVVQELSGATALPVIVNPNAGLPQMVGDSAVFVLSPEAFAAEMAALFRAGATLLGGCCGTTPAHIAALTKAISPLASLSRIVTPRTLVSSYAQVLELGKAPVVIGERLNPTGKPRLKEALRAGDMDFLVQEALAQQNAGAQALDVNVGLPELDEPTLLPRAVTALAAAVPLPLQLDSGDPKALAAAMRVYNGKPLVNSVSGKQESMDAVFPLVAQYGGVAVALTLDEKGIPETAEERVNVALRIRAEAMRYGIAESDLLFDPLTLPVAVDPQNAEITLEAVRRLTVLGLRTILGISNVSFGLPDRETVNAGFLARALETGLSAAILNPLSSTLMEVAARGGGAEYKLPELSQAAEHEETGSLSQAIERGLAGRAETLCRALLETEAPIAVIEGHIIPALDAVGRGFENKTVYLPGLLLAAEAAKAAFGVARKKLPSVGEQSAAKTIVLATVRGDIHDIGKNIAAALLENYGYRVLDLGRDVPPETVAGRVLAERAPLAGLSALMTTTVPAMRETIALLRKHAPQTRIMVGGAVLTEALAAMLGADCYAADAMAGVRFAEQVFANVPRGTF
ncbi:MAG: homocysteine S-methyltransferase family protein [Clostridiales bacterium]|nr:homocysteine S-methyltransferase family protein [Clostridiales bacterium]